MVHLTAADALLVTDIQADFLPGGALGIAGGDRVIAPLNDWIARVSAAGGHVFATRDWHPAGHCSFREQGGPWPVHCVAGTPGAAFSPALRLPAGCPVVSKATDPAREAYSVFEGTGLAAELRRRGVRRVWIGGLATDYCVRASTLDALREGFEVHVLVPACCAVDVRPGDGARALEEIRAAGGILEG